MVSQEHVTEELSAYLDGEIGDPERIRRHLQLCPECARRHLELVKLSSRIRALPDFTASPGFEEKLWGVLEMRPARSRFRPVLVAAAAILVAGFFWLGFEAAWRDTAPRNLQNISDTRAMAELAKYLGQDAESLFPGQEEYYAEAEEAAPTYEEMTAWLAASVPEEPDEELADDPFALMETLSREEQDALAFDLETYRNEG